jgi:CheY-like chemotaxis protein
MAKRILIVDDSVIVRNSLRAMLEDLDEFGGIACEEAADGRQAISKARDLLPDLTILDLSMPVMNGLDAAYELKRILPAVPIIMYTSYASASLRQVAEAAGIARVVDKASPHNLLVVIRSLFAPSA